MNRRRSFGERREREMGGTGSRAVTTYPAILCRLEVWDFDFNCLCGIGHLPKGFSDRMNPTDSADDSLPSPSLNVPPRHPPALGEN